jgi:hypothetical protein
LATKIDDENADKPLDPAVERVRRKLVRFVAVNLGLLFLALMAVAVAIVYKSGSKDPARAEASLVPDSGSPINGTIILPAGARLVQQSLDGDRLAFDVTLADGARAIFVYDIARARMLGRYDLRFEGN